MSPRPGVVERALTVIRALKCAEGEEDAVDLAVREALANAIVHGCAKNPRGSVDLTVACDESRGVLIIVRDCGEGFDPSSLQSPVRGQGLHASHGRGIFLINQLMDDVEFRRGGTETRMRKS